MTWWKGGRDGSALLRGAPTGCHFRQALLPHPPPCVVLSRLLFFVVVLPSVPHRQCRPRGHLAKERQSDARDRRRGTSGRGPTPCVAEGRAGDDPGGAVADTFPRPCGNDRRGCTPTGRRYCRCRQPHPLRRRLPPLSSLVCCCPSACAAASAPFPLPPPPHGKEADVLVEGGPPQSSHSARGTHRPQHPPATGRAPNPSPTNHQHHPYRLRCGHTTRRAAAQLRGDRRRHGRPTRALTALRPPTKVTAPQPPRGRTVNTLHRVWRGAALQMRASYSTLTPSCLRAPHRAPASDAGTKGARTIKSNEPLQGR